MDLREAVEHSSLFRDVAPEDVDRIAAMASLRRFATGDIVVREDEEARDLFLICAGRAEVEVRSPLREGAQGEAVQRLGTLRSGDVIGEIALVDRCLRSATVRATGALEVVVIPNEALRKTLTAAPALGYLVMTNVAKLLAARIRETNLKLRNTIANLSF
ncbi:MAG: cyclic nucleotide-binding domain-containing protein [Polyangiaceae bacterium]